VVVPSQVTLTANLTATGLAKGGQSVHRRTAYSTILLGLEAGGHDSMELKILWSESSVRVRPPPPALKIKDFCALNMAIGQLDSVLIATVERHGLGDSNVRGRTFLKYA
jgi:hypothetical protein